MKFKTYKVCLIMHSDDEIDFEQVDRFIDAVVGCGDAFIAKEEASFDFMVTGGPVEEDND